MLLNSHQLDAVVAALFDVWEHIFCKLTILSDSSVLTAHANVSLVDFQIFGHLADALMLELVL